MKIDETKLAAIKDKMYNSITLTLEEQSTYAADAINRGIPMKEIANILGKTVTSISMNLYHHGFTASEEEIAFANLVRENKLTVKDIMLATKQSSKDVYKGLAAALYYVKEEDQYPTWQELYTMYTKDRKTLAALADYKGCAVSTLKQHFAKLSGYKPDNIQGTETWDELLVMLKAKAITLQDICISKSVSVTVVIKELERVGYKKQHANLLQENKDVSWEELYKLYTAGSINMTMAMELKNCTRYKVLSNFKKLGYSIKCHRKTVI
jgi:hypothetical protein